MIIDDRKAHVFIKFFYVHSTLSSNVGIYMIVRARVVVTLTVKS